MELVVMFPDYQGKGTLSNFLRRVKQAAPDAIIVPVLNGADTAELGIIAEKIKTSFCNPIIAADAKNLVDVLMAGYSHVLNMYPEAAIVRLDTAEHPPEFIPELAEIATYNKSMVIGDLDFNSSTLREGSVDEFTHLNLFPELYRQMTGGRIEISCAHGYQAFAPGICQIVFETAQKIVQCVNDKIGVVKYGFDGAMALAAAGIGIKVVIEKIPAETLRDRTREKIATQFSNALQMCLAARSLFQFS